jgi:hypothetical protein
MATSIRIADVRFAEAVRVLIADLEARARFATSRADRPGRRAALPFLAGHDCGVAFAFRQAAEDLGSLLDARGQ